MINILQAILWPLEIELGNSIIQDTTLMKYSFALVLIYLADIHARLSYQYVTIHSTRSTGNIKKN